ncbi:MAG: glycosyltransferase family 4 protein [Thermogemmatispora sp.]|nr:glycosyltransferase family 4 protein [Thermogemmatispora sp.]
MMHIGINAQLLSYSQSYRNSGVSRYIRRLLEGLAQEPGEYRYTIFVNGHEVEEHLAPVASHPQLTYVSAPWPEERPWTRVAWEQLKLPGELRQRHIQLLHSPVNVLPLRLPAGCRGVVTLHDLAFLRFPEVLTGPKRLYQRTFTLRSLRRATLVITVSESTRRDAIELLSLPEERLRTVYPSIDARFSASPRDEQAIQALRARYGLESGFILYLGTLEPRKNLDTLIEAFARLKGQHGIREKLVLAGSKGWLYEAIFARVRSLGLESEVLFPGFIADSEQVLWYHAATAFAYPSLYEGFGLPVAEALACGLPVVTSSVSSLPEAGAGVALTVEPRNVDALAHALYRALNDESYRQHCRAMASMVAERFSLRTMARRMRAIYEEALSEEQRQLLQSEPWPQREEQDVSSLE